VPADFCLETWDKLEIYFRDLEQRPLSSVADLQKWLKDWSELDAVTSEDFAWRYIRMTCDTESAALTDAYLFFVEKIEPFTEPYTNTFNKKLISSPFLGQLDRSLFGIYLRGVENDLALFREENIPLFTRLASMEREYAAIAAAMSVSYSGKEYTLQQAAVFLKSSDRAVREKVYGLVQNRRMEDEGRTDQLYDELIALRQQVATQTGFLNFRDYMFRAMGRFDYSAKDCFDFHEAIHKQVIPVVDILDRERMKLMHLDQLKPWDMEAEPDGKEPLHPFDNGADLLDKAIQCFAEIRPYYGECLEVMKKMKRLDLDSRMGKAPGGYNYPLNETGVPFIFMNSAGLHRDLVTMVHEGGHALHAFLTNALELEAFKNYPSEVAELASMSMELISMEHWDVFFKDEDDLRRAKKEQLEKILRILPWISVIDKFQHWVYENYRHTHQERVSKWTEMISAFGSTVIDWTGLEKYRMNSWHAQLHLFDAPFYYIEYGFAQLGALAVWRNYKQNRERTLNQYETALKLGYTRSIPEIYAAAGIRFDFSEGYVKEILDFVKQELKNLL